MNILRLIFLISIFLNAKDSNLEKNILDTNIQKNNNRELFNYKDKNYKKPIVKNIKDYLDNLYFWNLYYGVNSLKSTKKATHRDLVGLSLGRRLNIAYFKNAIEADILTEPEVNLKRKTLSLFGIFLSSTIPINEDTNIKFKLGFLDKMKKFPRGKFAVGIFLRKYVYTKKFFYGLGFLKNEDIDILSVSFGKNF